MASTYLSLHYHLVLATKALRPLRGRWAGAIRNRWCRCAQPPANCCNASGVKRLLCILPKEPPTETEIILYSHVLGYLRERTIMFADQSAYESHLKKPATPLDAPAIPCFNT